MNKYNQLAISKFKQNMARKLFLGVITETLIFFITLFILYLVAYYVFQLWTWQGYELIYIIAKAIANHLILTTTIIGIIGFSAILIHSWLKSLGYLEQVLNATENIYNSQNDLIKLPPELKEIEQQMNQIKLNVRESKRTAQEAEQRKNDLVVYLAHDLKTPLTSVIGYLTLLHDENKISEPLRQKYLAIALDKAQRLEDLINEFFEITRFNLSTLTLELSQVNLTRLLEQLVYEFKPMLADKHLQCLLHADANIMLQCDVDKMQRVFDNLLRNAVNYSWENSTVHINVAVTNRQITIGFINQGNTITTDKLQRIFEQFYRLDTARTSKNGGAGLGLAIAKEIVELHQGTITACSENNRISFEITMPIGNLVGKS